MCLMLWSLHLCRRNWPLIALPGRIEDLIVLVRRYYEVTSVVPGLSDYLCVVRQCFLDHQLVNVSEVM